MSRLRIYDHERPDTPAHVYTEHAQIARELARVGVDFEQWTAAHEIAPGASQEEVIAAYRSDIDRLMQQGGYQSVDVVSIAPDHPDRAALRQKFLAEHAHSEDEVRFFVAGSGQFNLHIGDKVYEVLCTKGDLIRVPDGAHHWFDMGDEPSFVAIRLFTNKEGWVAHFTGSDIAGAFPRMAEHAD